HDREGKAPCGAEVRTQGAQSSLRLARYTPQKAAPGLSAVTPSQMSSLVAYQFASVGRLSVSAVTGVGLRMNDLTTFSSPESGIPSSPGVVKSVGVRLSGATDGSIRSAGSV